MCYSRCGIRRRTPARAARLALALRLRPPPKLLERLLRLFHFEQEGNLVHHAADRRRVLEDPLAADPGEAEAAQGGPVIAGVSAHAADELDAKGHGSRSLGGVQGLLDLGELLAAQLRHV